MKHEINLSKYNLHTDLAIESVNEENIIRNQPYDNITISKINIDDEIEKQINKKKGKYITIEFNDVTDTTNKENVKHTFIQEIKSLLKEKQIPKSASCLIVGLGNNKSTPDSLGPQTINKLIITNHLYEIKQLALGYRRISAIIPGVTGETGIETYEIVKSISNKIKPDFLIVIDALASTSIERVNKTIQITDTGIHPGSGIGNNRKEISKETMNIPVIAIGVPTTVDAVTIVSDTIEYMIKHFSYLKQNLNNPINKLIVNKKINYLKKNIEINPKDKIKLLGLVGELNHEETRTLIEEVLSPIGYNFMVTPKEIDFLIIKLSEIIGDGLNEALHNLK